MRLTPLQRASLIRMRVTNSCYLDRSDRTMQALERRGLATWYHGAKYSRSRWLLTTRGAEIAWKL